MKLPIILTTLIFTATIHAGGDEGSPGAQGGGGRYLETFLGGADGGGGGLAKIGNGTDGGMGKIIGQEGGTGGNSGGGLKFQEGQDGGTGGLKLGRGAEGGGGKITPETIFRINKLLKKLSKSQIEEMLEEAEYNFTGQDGGGGGLK